MSALAMVNTRTDCEQCFGTGLVPWPIADAPIEQRSCICRGGKATWAGNHHPLKLVTGGDNWVGWVDVGIATDIERLWGEGIPTWVSCQGDATMTRYISVVGLEHLEAASALLPWAHYIVVRPELDDLIFEESA